MFDERISATSGKGWSENKYAVYICLVIYFHCNESTLDFIVFLLQYFSA